MSMRQVREAPDTLEARAATLADLVTVEPSHIHIPRPSRVRRSLDSRLDDGEPLPMQRPLEATAAA